MRVLVTGSEGYIGTILGAYLMERGDEVTGLDTGFHRVGWMYHGVDQAPRWIAKDVRQVTVDDLRGYDAVVHLAELSNDPVGQLDPAITFEINHGGSVRLAALARDAGVERFVYMSSCSVYGAAGDRDSTETSDVDPLTPYAMSKVMVERDVLPMADDDFSPTSLRNATAYGASPRMRFDLVVNDLAGHAWTEQVIRVDSDGRPWRPFIHVFDICRAVDLVLRARRDVVHGQVFNVGTNEQNYQVRTIAEIIADAFPGCRTEFGEIPGDRRNYRANFDKIRDVLGFKPLHDVVSGTQELLAVFRRIDLSLELFESPAYTRLKQIRHLRTTGQIDERFFWVDPPRAARPDRMPEAARSRA